MNETDIAFKNRCLENGAIMSRCKLTEVKISHSNNEIFPYSAEELALYMHHICEQLEAPPQDPSEISSLSEYVEYQEHFESRDERILQGVRIEEGIVSIPPFLKN
jgi:hypothetical protein